MKKKSLFAISIAVAMSASLPFISGCSSDTSQAKAPLLKPVEGFVVQQGSKLMLNGKEYRIAGTNNYYMHYGELSMIRDVLNDAQQMGINTIRVWGFMDGVNHGHSMQIKPGVYEADGVSNSYDKLDFTVAEAKKRGIRVVIALTNNWGDFGGIPQYVEWFNAKHHDDFYRDDKIKECFKAYVKNLITHKNKYTGVENFKESAIMTWELANEPRAQSDKSGRTLYNWAKEMSDYVRTLAPNQLIALGTEGFFARANNDDWCYNGNDGIDWDKNITLPNINYGTLHLYPETWVKPEIEQWGSKWIRDHAVAARRADKPVVLEEYGVTATAPIDRAFVYKRWTDVSYKEGLAGTMFWILTSSDPNQADRLYPDYDGFRVLNDGSLTAQIITEHNLKLQGENIDEPNRLFIASPVKGQKITGENVVIKSYPTAKEGVKVQDITIKNIKTSKTYKMTDTDGDGYYEASIPTASLGYGEQYFIAQADFDSNGSVNTKFSFETQQKIVGQKPLTVYDFSNGTQGWEKEGTWQADWTGNGLELSNDLGKPMLKLNAKLSGMNDWEELKFRNAHVSDLSKCNRLRFSVYIPTANAKKGGVRHYAALADGWVKLDTDKNNKDVTSLEKVTLNGVECYKQDLDISLGDPSGKNPDVFICIVGNKMPYEGPIYVSDIVFTEPQFEK
ncbi:MAG: cellulase family glycosylhydrolase [Succinivibrio sp.]